MTTDLLLIPLIHNNHWTLLVENLIKKVWELYDSLPKATHIAIIPEVPIRPVLDAPTQKNSFDCRMFICKYMEAVVQP
ncbi:hypothetical protein IEQ34_007115 [Dendrobium chrysotoxum]|uniref:Ubiquitin-like protease family profile domain-containing protein n=1 Tax=Dendrobium chrysotoxum TaxID=161865 RepID=A0AAV7H9E2_DENCH|nr:hypothetical protein IEQ34_007115 [Dendrobium chrysotoxum]